MAIFIDIKDQPPFELAIDQIGAEIQNNAYASLQMEPDANFTKKES